MLRRFGERHLRHGKGQFAGEPFAPEGWQIECEEAIYDDLLPTGLRRVREALVGMSKKDGKTHWGAKLGAYGLYADGRWKREGGAWVWKPEFGAEVYNVAGSRQQAKVLFEIASGFVQRSPVLRSMSRIYRDAIEVPETESVWRVLAADAKLAHGPNPSTAIIDEIWVHSSPDLYEAFASAGAAREQPLLIVITTAGFDQSSFAYKLYEAGRKSRSPRLFFRWWEAPAGAAIDDPKGWKAANPSRWVTKAYLTEELRRARRNGTESEFRRWHLNQWTSAKELAIPMELWDTCAARPRIPAGAEVVLGVDAAPKRDSTAVAIVHRDAAGTHHVKIVVMAADPETGYLDFGALEDLIRELCRSYNVTRILTDPAYMIRSMLMLADEGYPVEEFSQGDQRMVPASMNLYELLIDGRVRHGGARDLREQVAAASKRVTERGWRLHKRTSSGVIDGVIAVAMASYEIERGAQVDEEKQPSLFV